MRNGPGTLCWCPQVPAVAPHGRFVLWAGLCCEVDPPLWGDQLSVLGFLRGAMGVGVPGIQTEVRRPWVNGSPLPQPSLRSCPLPTCFSRACLAWVMLHQPGQEKAQEGVWAERPNSGAGKPYPLPGAAPQGGFHGAGPDGRRFPLLSPPLGLGKRGLFSMGIIAAK